MSPRDTEICMNCDRLQEALVVDKTRLFDLCADLKTHLGQCVECRTFAEDYSALFGDLDQFREVVLNSYEMSRRAQHQLTRTLVDLVSDDVRSTHQQPRSWLAIMRSTWNQMIATLSAVLAGSPGLRLATQMMILVAVGILGALVWQINADDTERAVFAAEIHSVSPVVPIPVDPEAISEPLRAIKNQAERMDLSPAILSQPLSGRAR